MAKAYLHRMDIMQDPSITPEAIVDGSKYVQVNDQKLDSGQTRGWTFEETTEPMLRLMSGTNPALQRIVPSEIYTETSSGKIGDQDMELRALTAQRLKQFGREGCIFVKPSAAKQAMHDKVVQKDLVAGIQHDFQDIQQSQTNAGLKETLRSGPRHTAHM
jgi:hypothetical protein